ncbi:MAG: hypothetical protein KGZ82_13500, partial [Bacteroidales bacterium]|nr:hypothetical protein [Bacteroidales bacterium]
MKNGKDISILDELNNRLDDFFSDDDIIEEKKKINESKSITTKDNPKNNKIQNDKPFDLLRAILLEMDWEINEVNLNKYLDELNVLSNKFSNDRVIYLFLKLLKSLGIYMLYKKSNANPDVLKFLYNSFNCIEKIVINDLTIFDKNLLIIKETEKFKQLKSSMFPNKYKNSKNDFNDNINGKKKINFKSLP